MKAALKRMASECSYCTKTGLSKQQSLETRCGCWPAWFFLVAKSWQVQSGLVSVVLYLSLLCPELSETTFEDSRAMSCVPCSHLPVLTLSSTGSPKPKAGAVLYAGLVLLQELANSLAYSLMKDMHSCRAAVGMTVCCEGLTGVYQGKLSSPTSASAKYEQFLQDFFQDNNYFLIVSVRGCCCWFLKWNCLKFVEKQTWDAMLLL